MKLSELIALTIFIVVLIGFIIHQHGHFIK